MIYNTPPFAIIGPEVPGRGDAEGSRGQDARCPGSRRRLRAVERLRQGELTSTADAVTIENVGFPVREPMLAQGKVDAITGFSFSSYINLKANGVPEDDITLMADERSRARPVRQRPSSSTPTSPPRTPRRSTAFLRATIKGFQETAQGPGHGRLPRARPQRRRPRGGGARATRDGARAEHDQRRGARERHRRGRHGAPRDLDGPDRRHLRVREPSGRETRSSTPPSCRPPRSGRSRAETRRPRRTGDAT